MVPTWPEAEARWSDWTKQADATGKIIDKDFGEMPHTMINNHHHIRIPTEVDMAFRNTSARINELEGTVRTHKKPEQEKLDAEISKLGIGLNMFGKAEVDIAQVAAASVANAAGVLTTGHDISVTLPGVRSL